VLVSELWISKSKRKPKLERADASLADVRRMIEMCRKTPGVFIPPTWLKADQAHELARRIGVPVARFADRADRSSWSAGASALARLCSLSGCSSDTLRRGAGTRPSRPLKKSPGAALNRRVQAGGASEVLSATLATSYLDDHLIWNSTSSSPCPPFMFDVVRGSNGNTYPLTRYLDLEALTLL
jgi:hypothetical protein